MYKCVVYAGVNFVLNFISIEDIIGEIVIAKHSSIHFLYPFVLIVPNQFFAITLSLLITS